MNYPPKYPGRYPGAAELINGKDGMDPLDARMIEQDVEAVKPESAVAGTSQKED